jgi:hypothetical protein
MTNGSSGASQTFRTEVPSLQRGEKITDALIAVLLVALYSILILRALHPRISIPAFSDLKTVFASSWCLAHHINAYDPANIGSVFRNAGIPLPKSWFGRAPVYPPFTLLLFLPLAGMPFVPAIYLLTAVWFAALAVTLTVLMHYAAEEFGLRMPSRLLLAGAFVVSPYLLAAVICGNLCIPATCLAICAFTRRKARSPWLPALALALAAALKPHLAIWAILAMLLLPGRASRRVAVRSLVVLAGLALATILVLAATHQLALQVHGYRAVLASEMSGDASMSPTTRGINALTTQVTSLKSIIGFWQTPGVFASLLCDLFLFACAVAALLLTGRASSERQALLSVAVWTAFGLSATYHRAFDGMIVLIILPWVLASLSAAAQRWKAVAIAVFLIAASCGPELPTVLDLTNDGHLRTMGAFLLIRQAALADLCIVLVLLFLLWREAGAKGSAHAE